MGSEIGFPDKAKEVSVIVAECKSITVKTAQEHAQAEEVLKSVRQLEKELEEAYKSHPIIIDAKRIQSQKSEMAKALEDARKGLKNGAMLAYERAEEAKRQAEERRLQEEARKRAESEAIAAAAEAEKAGNKAEAEAIIAEPVSVPTVVLPKTTPTTKRRMVRKFRIINSKDIKRDFLTPDMVAIGQVVRALGKAAENTVGGIEFYEEPA